MMSDVVLIPWSW